MILHGPQLPKIREQHAGERIVLATGCFDLFHNGHVDYLHRAEQVGDIVLVSLLGNRKIREIKKSPRPFNTTLARAVVLDSQKSVDYVTVEPYRSGTQRAGFFETVDRLQPDVFIGDETWFGYEHELALRGVEFVFRGEDKVNSTSDMVDRIRLHLQGSSPMLRPA